MTTPAKTNSETQAKTWLTPDQIEPLVDAAMTTGPDYLQDRNETIITILADTGLRVSELVALDWDDVHLDVDDPHIYLPASKQKGDPGAASIDLGSQAARQLRRFERTRYKETDAVFFTRQSDRASTRTIRNVVTDVATNAGVRPHLVDGGKGEPEEITPHTFRHSIAYRMIRVEEKRLEDVQLRLRHKSRMTTENVYGHLRRR